MSESESEFKFCRLCNAKVGVVSQPVPHWTHDRTELDKNHAPDVDFEVGAELVARVMREMFMMGKMLIQGGYSVMLPMFVDPLQETLNDLKVHYGAHPGPLAKHTGPPLGVTWAGIEARTIAERTGGAPDTVPEEWTQ